MSTKHFINDPTHLVNSALHAVTLTNPGIGLDAKNKILYVRPGHGPLEQRVSIVSGGGSGHEPSFASMVGPGVLSAAVVGTLFASPNAEQVHAALMARVDHNGLENKDTQSQDSGILVIVMNYTGDVLNFGVAVEMARAAGVNVHMVTVGDDVAVGRSRAGNVGRRGIAGTVLVQKMSGALASMGYSLERVAAVTQLVADNVATIGATLDHVHVPGSEGLPNMLEAGEVEVGMGIHNEQGWSREDIQLPALVRRLLAYLLARDDPERSFVDFGTSSTGVVLLLNNLGGLSPLELGGVLSEVVLRLGSTYDIHPVRIFSGTYMTSLDARGFSITLLRVVDTGISGVDATDLLDYPCEALGWTSTVGKATWEAKNVNVRDQDASRKLDTQPSGLILDPKAAENALIAGLQCLISAEPEITRFDLVVGDGDCGTTLERGAQAILEHVSEHHLSGDAAVDVANIARVVENYMDGTSGALYAIFLNALVGSLRSLAPGKVTPKLWAIALSKSCEVLAKYTPASPGDRTLIDALYPFVEVLGETGDVTQASNTSMDAANATKGLRAKLGRTVYLGGFGFEEVPDPGAWGLATFFLGLASPV